MTQNRFTILDTTLRDGEQAEKISFTVKDKLKITTLLDAIGIHYIEGGWPGSNPKAVEYFENVHKLPLKHAKIAAFGSTRRAQNTTENDPNLKALLDSNAPTLVIVGKTWDFHVTHALGITLEENLALIGDSVRYLKSKGREVIFDAEHFFDGTKHNAAYALSAIRAAADAGADIVCLCDTNGGSLPSEIGRICAEISKNFPTALGIHTHNDAGMAVANTIAAIENGIVHVQGTFNGYGERCGNANLSSILPTLMLKMGIPCLTTDQLAELTATSRHLDEIANLPHDNTLPYVGRSAFAHKGGIHVSAILKHPETYEHVVPTSVGNEQRVLVSELSGVSNLAYKAEGFGLEVDPKSEAFRAMLIEIKTLEHQGYQFEEGDASFELLMRRHLQHLQPMIHTQSFRVTTDRGTDETLSIEATLKATINGHAVHVVGEGNGPVNALDHALRRAIEPVFPQIQQVKMTDYKVRVLNSRDGTHSLVRVWVESQDGDRTWGTVGVSSNIIEASWMAMLDSFEYFLLPQNPSLPKSSL